MHEQDLADRERVIGVYHPDTLASRNNLAYAYLAVGRLAEAIPLYEQNIADLERDLGVDHRGILASRTGGISAGSAEFQPLLRWSYRFSHRGGTNVRGRVALPNAVIRLTASTCRGACMCLGG